MKAAIWFGIDAGAAGIDPTSAPTIRRAPGSHISE